MFTSLKNNINVYIINPKKINCKFSYISCKMRPRTVQYLNWFPSQELCKFFSRARQILEATSENWLKNYRHPYWPQIIKKICFKHFLMKKALSFSKFTEKELIKSVIFKILLFLKKSTPPPTFAIFYLTIKRL